MPQTLEIVQLNNFKTFCYERACTLGDKLNILVIGKTFFFALLLLIARALAHMQFLLLRDHRRFELLDCLNMMDWH